MNERFADVLAVGGKLNTLGRANEVTDAVLQDNTRLEELYECLFHEDAWIRMRAADSLEKICREHPGWLEPYIDRLARDFGTSTQPSVQWHIAQIYGEVRLSDAQRRSAITWLSDLLLSRTVDWIVAANAMDTLAIFVQQGVFAKTEFEPLVRIQLGHKSNAVKKRAEKHLQKLASER